MSLAQKITYNAFIQTVGRMAAIALGVITLGIIARYLGPHQFGEYSIVVAFLQFFAILSDLGLTLVSLQMISDPRFDEEKTFNSLLTLRFFTSLIVFSLAPLTALFFPYSFLVKKGIFIFALAFIFTSLVQIFTSFFQKNLRIIKATVADVIGKTTILLVVIASVVFQWGFWGILLAGIAGPFFNLSYLFYSASQKIKIYPSFNIKIWKKALSKSWPIALSIFFNLIYLKTDTLILSLYYPPSTVGLYSAAFKFLEILIAFPTLLMGLILPILTAQWVQQNKESFSHTLRYTFQAITALALPLVVGGIILAPQIISLIVGSSYLEAAPILRIIMLACGMVFFGVFFGHVIVAINKQKQTIWIYGLTAILSLAGYFVFIPRFSYWGAAWVTVFSEFSIALLTFLVIKKNVRFLLPGKETLKIFLASSIMGAILYSVKEKPFFLTFPLGASFYFIVLYFLEGIPKSLFKKKYSL